MYAFDVALTLNSLKEINDGNTIIYSLSKTKLINIQLIGLAYHIKNYRRDLIVVDDRENNIELSIGFLEDQDLYSFFFFDNLN